MSIESIIEYCNRKAAECDAAAAELQAAKQDYSREFGEEAAAQLESKKESNE